MQQETMHVRFVVLLLFFLHTNSLKNKQLHRKKDFRGREREWESLIKRLQSEMQCNNGAAWVTRLSKQHNDALYPSPTTTRRAAKAGESSSLRLVTMKSSGWPGPGWRLTVKAFKGRGCVFSRPVWREWNSGRTSASFNHHPPHPNSHLLSQNKKKKTSLKPKNADCERHGRRVGVKWFLSDKLMGLILSFPVWTWTSLSK